MNSNLERISTVGLAGHAQLHEAPRRQPLAWLGYVTTPVFRQTGEMRSVSLTTWVATARNAAANSQGRSMNGRWYPGNSAQGRFNLSAMMIDGVK